MRTVLIALLSIAFMSGCTKDGTSSFSSRPEGFYAPADALRIAEVYISSLKDQKSPLDQRGIRKDFVSNFFVGFTSPGASVSGGTESGRCGFLAGQAYFRDNPTRVKDTMEGFGYITIEAEGTWTVGFEHSQFRPRIHPEQKWWLSNFVDMRSDIPEDRKIPLGGVNVRVTGFLSPTGHYGHLAGYDHEFFATKISQIDGR